MNFIILFITLSIINVIFSTVRSIATIKGSSLTASLLSGGYFAFYNIMLIYTVADFPMWQKCIITFFCNVIGVYIVKAIEARMKKDKMWKIEITIYPKYKEDIVKTLDCLDIPYNYIDINKYFIFNIYCKSQKESQIIKDILPRYHAKYFVSETKTL